MDTDKELALAALSVPVRTKPSVYPEPFASRMNKRFKRQLGDYFGIKKFGVNLTELAPGGESSLLHKHTLQEEFIYILNGRPTLILESEEIELSPGMCAGFTPKGSAHTLVNRTLEPVQYIEIGDREAGDVGIYPQDDLVAKHIGGEWRFSHKDGSAYGTEPRLQAPGAGISKVELIILNRFIKPLLFRNSNLQTALEAVTRSADELLTVAAQIAPEALTERKLVPRSLYIEDSSRFWSVAMLFRHLTKVNAAVTKAIFTQTSIKAEVLPAPSARVAAVKPELERNDDSSIAEFKASIEKLKSSALAQAESALRERKIPHPWMGDISHLQWLRFVAFHHRIHGKQLRRIARQLRVR